MRRSTGLVVASLMAAMTLVEAGAAPLPAALELEAKYGRRGSPRARGGDRPSTPPKAENLRT
ncbi:MAG TPA: hypothetical protein VNI01_04465, partial [Elusimicrobiota bacterium]|nr:hypothetical protein [Elusimicrobiota bacterium]